MPTYSQTMALVGRIPQANAAKAKPHFLAFKGSLLEDGRKQGQ